MVCEHPAVVESVKDKVALQAAASFWHSLVILREPSDEDGDTTARDTASTFTRTTVTSVESAHVALPLPPWKHHLLYYPVMRGGTVYTFGSGMDGQLGLGPVSIATVPTRVACLPKV